MPTKFTVINDFDQVPHAFNRFHLSEVTGERLKSRAELPDEEVSLTNEQAHALVDKWNEFAELHGFYERYEVYHE